MSAILRLDNPLTDAYYTLRDLVNGQDFPWYYFDHSVEGMNDEFENCPFYGHTILARPGHGGSLHPTQQSPHLDLANLVLSEVFDYNKIDVNIVYRINVNCTHWSSLLPSVPHVDHNFPHKNLIMYLSQFDYGDTCLWDEKTMECIDRYLPDRDDIVTFEGLHNIEQPRLGCRRIVLVATYS